MFYPRGKVDCQKVKWHQTDMQIPKFQIFWYYFRFLWWPMCLESLDMETNYYLQSSHGGKSVSGCLPLPCSHHGGPNKGWGLGAWGSWRILGLLQTNSWDLWGRNSHCCVKIITKGWNDYLHKKRESNDVCTNQNFHSILIFVPNVWGVDSKYRNTAVVFTPFGRCLRVNWESFNTARKEKRKKPKEKRSTRKMINYDHAAPQVWKNAECDWKCITMPWLE